MSQPPYQPYPGEPGPEGGYQPPAAPGSYPPPQSPGSYPPPGQGSYPQPGQGSYPQPGQGSYPQPGQGSYPPPGQGSYPPGSYPPPPGPDQGVYPPPGAGQPGPGAPQYGMGAPPKKKSSALKIVLIVVGVVALLCVAGGVVAFVAAKDKVEQVVDATKISVVEPETLGGRPKASDAALQTSVNSLDGVMSDLPGATGSVGGIYGDLQKQDVVMVAAASSINGSAQDRFDAITAGMGGAGGVQVDNFTDVEPGPLGGIAKCGDTTTAGVPMAVCVWSDNGSAGMLLMMFKEKADLEKEFVTMRGEVEKKA